MTNIKDVSSITMSKCGKYTVTGTSDGKINIYDTKNKKFMRKNLKIHEGPVISISISKNFVLSGGKDNKAVLYNVYSNKIESVFFHDAPVASVAIS